MLHTPHPVLHPEQKSDKQSTKLVSEFQKSKKHMLLAANREGGGEPGPGLEAVAKLREVKDQLCRKLLELETALHEQCIEISNEFEIKYMSMGTQRKDMFGAFFREAEDQENACVSAVC